MAKKLMINCASCDARMIRAENYAHYEAITINCAAVLTNPNAKAVMSKLPITLNCADVLEMDGEVDFRTVNGSGEIRSSDAVPERKYYMMVNGALTIGSGTQKQLEKCVGMTVNGSLTCPESINAYLTGVKVNGSTTCYPDGAIVLKRSAVIDKLFALRAKPDLYWSGRRMIMVDPELNSQALKAKGARFSAPEIIIAQSKVENMVELIDEKAEIFIVPDGTSVILNDVTLDDTTLRRFGKKLYVIGDVTVPEDAGALESLEYLNVRGDALVPQEQKEKLLDVLTEISGQIRIRKPRGTVLSDKPLVKVTRWMLEQQPLGIEIRDCAIVKISDDVPRELIVERLRISDVAEVRCSEELEDAVALVCEDVVQIGGGDGAFQDVLGGLKGMLDTKVINASDYVL